MATETISHEPYESPATAGQGYTIQQMRWEGVEPDPFWTWKDARGYGPGISRAMDRHATREQAIAALEEYLHIEGVKEQVWTREQYEMAARAEWGEQAQDFLRDDRHMAGIVRDNADTWTPFYAFAVARLAGIRAEQAAHPQPERPKPAPQTLVACPNCGALVPPSQLMSASLGTGCPNCYDKLSS